MIKLQQALDRINKGDGTAGKLLVNPELYDSLNNTAKQLESISKDIREGRGSAGKFVNDDQFYVETKTAVMEMRAAAEKLNLVADDMRAITAGLSKGKGTAGKLLTDDKFYESALTALDRFNSTAGKLDAILGDAKGGKGTLGKLITDDSLYNNLNQTSANIGQLSTEGTRLVNDFRRDPKKYLRIRVSIF
jgi:phospholipid/cholesterol/gamma-HCH transport system substrate-binding protein